MWTPRGHAVASFIILVSVWSGLSEKKKRTPVWWLKQLKRKKGRNNNCSAKPRRWWYIARIFSLGHKSMENTQSSLTPLTLRGGKVNIHYLPPTLSWIIVLVHRNPALRTPRLYARRPRYYTTIFFRPTRKITESFYYFEDPVDANTLLLQRGIYGPWWSLHCIYKNSEIIEHRNDDFELMPII